MRWLIDAEELDLKEKRRVRGNLWSSYGAIGKIWGDDQSALAADFHCHYSFIPALDHSSGSDLELIGLTAIERAVKLGTVLESAGVLHGYVLSWLWTLTGSDDFIDVTQSGWGGYFARRRPAATSAGSQCDE